MEANYVHKDSTTLIQDETGTYIEIPKNKIKFNSKEAEIIFDLTLENDELRLKNQELKEKVKKLSQWDINKDTRNSRQRVANAKLLKENQELKLELSGYRQAILNNKEMLGLKEQNEKLKQKYLNAVSDYETTMAEKKELENQQKEFIEYMNKTIEELECDDVDDEEMKGYLIQRIDTFKEILQKYKELIGDDK